MCSAACGCCMDGGTGCSGLWSVWSAIAHYTLRERLTKKGSGGTGSGSQRIAVAAGLVDHSAGGVGGVVQSLPALLLEKLRAIELTEDADERMLSMLDVDADDRCPAAREGPSDPVDAVRCGSWAMKDTDCRRESMVRAISSGRMHSTRPDGVCRKVGEGVPQRSSMLEAVDLTLPVRRC